MAAQKHDRVELVWPGKATEVERVSLPFQTIERVNEVSRSLAGQSRLEGRGGTFPDWWPEGWRNKLIWGDNKQVLSSLLDEFAGQVDLIYIDPPFDTGDDFSVSVLVGEQTAKSDAIAKQPSQIEQVAYRDLWKGGVGGWLQHMYERLTLAKELLAPSGTIYIHLDWTTGHHARLLLDEVFGADNSLGEVVWNYGSPSGGRVVGRKLVKAHDIVYAYAAKRGDHKYRPYYLPYSEKYIRDWFRHEDENGRRYQRRQRRDPDGSTRWEKQYLDESLGVPASTVWTDIQQVYADPRAYKARTKSEVTGFNTQKPTKLMKRFIEISTDPGDLVLDFYSGSGSTLVSAEEAGRRWLGVDLGRFAIHTARKQLLTVENCHPFEVLNLGRYERSHWQGADVGEQIGEYYDFIIQLYGATRIQGFNHLHGIKDKRMVHVGATDAPVTADELMLAISECAEGSTLALDVLGWEWEMGLNPSRKDELAHFYEVDVHLRNIPREVMDQKAVDAGDIHFFELSVVDLEHTQDDRGLVVEIANFCPAIDEYMSQKVGDAISRWSDWIDYWSIDFDYDGETFVNSWQSYRTRQDPSLSLISDPHDYDSPGAKTIVVKVIDIFGNDTTCELTVEVE